jgi:tetratricopeptide (TPR) repeat protein
MRILIFVIIIFLANPVFAEDISLCKEGWNATESGFHADAIRLFNKCIEKGNLSKSSLARTYRNLGIASKRNGQFKEAIKNYDLALSLAPDDPWDDYVNRGNAWSELGEYQKAFNDYDKAMELRPNYNEAYFNRGIVYEKQNNFKKALEEFKKAYDYGLRSQLLYERFVAYGLIKDENAQPLSGPRPSRVK